MEHAPDARNETGTSGGSLDRSGWSDDRTTVAVRWLLLATVFAPFLFVRGVYFPYVTSRALLFRVLVGLAGLIFLWQALVRDVEVTDGRDPVLWALVAWVGAGLLSALLSPATHDSLFGSMERMWGLTQWFHLLLFYGLARVYFDGAWWSRFLRASLMVSVAVGLYAAGQAAVAHGIGPWWSAPVLGSARGSFASTLGNTGYLSAYALVHLVVAGIVWARSRGGWRALAAVAAGVNLLAFALGGSRAMTVGAVAGAVLGTALWAWSAWRSGEGAALRRAVLGAGGAVLAAGIAWAAGLLSPLAELPVVGRLATLGEGTDAVRRRLLAWEAGWEGFLARPLTGWGPDNFHLVFQRFADPEFYRTGEPYNWDRAHNVLVGAVAQAGALGALAYGAVWAAAGDRVRRVWTEGTLSRGPAGLLTLGVTAFLVYLLFWFEDHNSFFVLLALLAWVRWESAGTGILRLGPVREAASSHRLGLRAVVLGGLLLAGGLVVWRATNTARAARLLALAPAARGAAGTAVERYEAARRLRVPQQRDVAIRYAGFVRDWARGGFRELRRGRGSELFQRAVTGAEMAVNRALARAPGDGALLLSRSDVAYGAFGGSGAREAYRLAVESVEEALRFAPDRLHYYLVLASRQAGAGRTEEALATLERGIGRYPAFAEFYRVRSRMLADANRRDPALADLRRSLWLGDAEEGTEEVRRTAGAEARAGRPGRAAEIVADWAAARYDPGLWAELERPERRAFLREVGLPERVEPARDGGYAVAPRDLPLFVRWHRWARAAGDTAGARLAVETALDGLSEARRTERLRPALRTLLSRDGGGTP